jgi:hypothetical protein
LVCVLIAGAPLLAWAAYRAGDLLRARYTVTAEALTIEWGGRREVIPLPDVEEARPAADFEGELRPPALSWPGYVKGTVQNPTLGAVEFLATTSEKPGLVMVGYPGGWLALSPPDPAKFLAVLAERRAEGNVLTVEARSLYPELPRWALWRDGLALGLIAVGGLALLALFGYLILIFPQLPPTIALRFDAQGQPIRFGRPTGLFTLTLIGLLAWGLNTALGTWLHRREAERAAAYLLFAAAVVVQALAWVAAIGLLTAGAA